MKRGTALRRSTPLRRSAPITRRRVQEPAAVRPGSGAKEEPRVPARRSRSGGIKRKQRNPLKVYVKTLFSNIVRHRDGWTCLKCGRSRETNPKLVLQAAHIFSVGGHPAMEYDLDNAVCICYRDHIHGFHRDGGMLEWCDAHLAPTRMARLRLRALTTNRAGGRPFGLEGVRLFLEQQARSLGAPLPDPPRIAAVRKRA